MASELDGTQIGIDGKRHDIEDLDTVEPKLRPGDVGQLHQAAITAVAAPAAAITGGESPTEAEFNALRDVVAAQTTAINALITALENAKIVEPN